MTYSSSLHLSVASAGHDSVLQSFVYARESKSWAEQARCDLPSAKQRGTTTSVDLLPRQLQMWPSMQLAFLATVFSATLYYTLPVCNTPVWS